MRSSVKVIFTACIVFAVAFLQGATAAADEGGNLKSFVTTVTPRQLSCDGKGSAHKCSWDCWVGCTRLLQEDLTEALAATQDDASTVIVDRPGGNDRIDGSRSLSSLIPSGNPMPRQLSCDGEGSAHKCSWDCWVGCTRRLQENLVDLHLKVKAHENLPGSDTTPRQLTASGSCDYYKCSWYCWVGCTRLLQEDLTEALAATQDDASTVIVDRPGDNDQINGSRSLSSLIPSGNPMPRQLSCDGEGSAHKCSWDCWVGCTRRLQEKLVDLHMRANTTKYSTQYKNKLWAPVDLGNVSADSSRNLATVTPKLRGKYSIY